MKNLFKFATLLILTTLLISSCDEKDTASTKNEIVYKSLNKDVILIKDVQTLQESDDDISNHVDSILNGLIDAEVISTGQRFVDLDAEMDLRVGFEIIDLNLYNPNGLPESFDSLAARVIPNSVQILDNSTYGYPDALSVGDHISENGNWSDRASAVLGTFQNAGQFQGMGEKFLAIRFLKDNAFKYGWIKLYCSQHNDTLKIIDFAYNNMDNSVLNAGQTE